MMGGETLSLLLGTAVLWVLVAVAALLAYSRTSLLRSDGLSKLILAAGWLALVAQIAHFLEELNAGIYESLPQALGLQFWPRSAFIAINLAFIASFLVALGLRGNSRRIADVPLWFLAVASCANAIIHPALAIRAGAYFPGLLTSPLVGLSGVALLFALVRSTRRQRKGPPGKMEDPE
jgi:hypothetical protein